jgi:hypothetical protein
MALRQLLLRFWVTDHGDCHFREESLEKGPGTVVTSKRREELSKSSKSSNTRFTEFSELVGRRAARGIPERISRDGVGRNFKNAPIANRRHLNLN